MASLEAMATGLPTVVSDLACFRDVTRDGDNAAVETASGHSFLQVANIYRDDFDSVVAGG